MYGEEIGEARILAQQWFLLPLSSAEQTQNKRNVLSAMFQAHVSGAIFSGAIFSGAIFSGAIFSEFKYFLIIKMPSIVWHLSLSRSRTLAKSH
jgi:hypothetical protein